MFNPFTMRKWTAILSTAFLCVISFYVVEIYTNFWWALLAFFAALVLSMVLSNLLLGNPFTKMLEGSGIMAMDLNSTGIVTPFLVKVMPPYITGKLMGQPIKDSWDRELTFLLSEPKTGVAVWVGERLKITLPEDVFRKFEKDENGKYVISLTRNEFKKKGTFKNGKYVINEGAKAEWENGKLLLELDEETFNKGKFALFHRPLLIYNSMLKAFMTKESISTDEKNTFAEHVSLFLTRLVEELSSLTRDFARHVVETLRPKESMFKQWWFWVIVVVLIGIVVAMILPAVIEQIRGFMATSTDAIKPAVDAIPKGI